MNEYFCDNCQYRGRPSYADPCATCYGGEKWEPEESDDKENVTGTCAGNK